MRLQRGLHLHVLFLVFVPLALWFFWGKWWNLSKHEARSTLHRESSSIQHRISHQAASDISQDVLPDGADWYDTNGTPLFYSAWRARIRSRLPPPEPIERSRIEKHGARVACWPSSGGVWIKHADVVDMEFMGLSRFRNTARQFNQTAEDAFCTKLQMTGASWWSLPPSFDTKRAHLGEEKFACPTLEQCFEPDVKNLYYLAWPETETTACYVSIERAQEIGGEILGGYRNAMDMEERCNIIERLGGETCCSKETCPDLGHLDWSFRDPGPDGCKLPPLIVDQEFLDAEFNPILSRNILRWANSFCKRNGWQK